MRSKIAENNFIIIGRAGMDIYPDPPGTKTENATHFFACLGGSSANIAVAIARHGGKTALLTRVADDAIGRFAVNELNKYGIDATHVHSEGGEARNTLAIVETRVEDHQSVIYRNGAADFQMTIKDVESVDYASYGALITTGTVFAAEPSRSAAFHAMALAKDAGLPIIFDIDYRPYSWPSAEVAAEVYSRAGNLCDIVIGNDDEFGFMAGGKEKGLEFARDLAESAGSIIVYKMGEFGSITITPTEEFQTGIYRVEALKPTGAGDAFMGGFISSLANGFDIQDCVLRGSASAAIVVSKVGCAPAMPTARELEEFMENHDGPLDTERN
mgnify:CR=1 FL=1